MVFRSSTSKSEMERQTKLRPGLWKKGSGRLDEMNRFQTFETRNEPKLKRTDSRRLDNELRNEPVPDVPDVRMNETTGFGRLDNGNQNEPVFTSFYFGIGDT
ncbi:hypothetical protein RIR_jg14391.t1 [Rhizophagus irregularis DAOM 181602=DAOM 197198]|nr:hypothetical protein RIR_jg14391.t1 [Rhizophagus irregularis DAOM 181602=DAOM 197198]